jgi:hypothetical protein
VNAALGRRTSARRDLALVSCSLAVTALVLAAAAPFMMLGSPALAGSAERPWLGYHEMALAMAAACAVAGGAGLLTFWRGLLRSDPRSPRLAASLVLVSFALVGAQLSWTFRPYLVRPRSPEVVFIRSLEGSLLDAVGETMDSARGRFHREFAPVPGESP